MPPARNYTNKQGPCLLAFIYYYTKIHGVVPTQWWSRASLWSAAMDYSRVLAALYSSYISSRYSFAFAAALAKSLSCNISTVMSL